MIKTICDVQFKLENNILFKLNKTTKEWKNLNLLPVDKYGERVVSIYTKNHKTRTLRYSNIIKDITDDNFDITKLFRS